MRPAHRTLLEAVQNALISGDAALALTRIDALARRLERDRIAPESRPEIEAFMIHLRRLAEDSARGTQRGIDQIRDILATARTLQTSDSAGRRRQTATTAETPQRF